MVDRPKQKRTITLRGVRIALLYVIRYIAFSPSNNSICYFAENCSGKPYSAAVADSSCNLICANLSWRHFKRGHNKLKTARVYTASRYTWYEVHCSQLLVKVNIVSTATSWSQF